MGPENTWETLMMQNNQPILPCSYDISADKQMQPLI